MSEQNFDQTIAAYEKVKQTAAALRAEYEEVCAGIAETEAELKVLPLAHLPLEDLKAGILEFIDASGERYAEETIRMAISRFATGGMGGISTQYEQGKPLRYIDLERAISAADPAYGRAQLLTPEKNQFNDQVFYFFFSKLVREGLRKVMEDMTPAEFGYDAIHRDKIGTNRFERRAAILALENRLAELRERKAELAQKLRAIGFPVKA